MSVVSNLVVTPNRVEHIYQYMQYLGERGEKRSTLQELLSPEKLQVRSSDTDEESESSTTKTPMVMDVLSEALVLGIVEKYVRPEDNLEYLKLAKPLLNGEYNYLSYLEQALLVSKVANTLGQKNFPKIMAWFLMQESSKPIYFTAMPAQEIHDLFGEERITATNNSSMQNFYYWARYLGFSWWIESKSRGRLIHPDPTVFLARHLPDLLRGQGEMLLRNVMDELAQHYPFFEGGTVRVELEGMIPERRQLLPNELASSTSLALNQLQQKGVIRLTRISDAASMTLLTWPQSSSYSHITLTHEDA